MTIRSKNIFTTVRTEGAILPADLLQRVVDGDKALAGLSPTSYHLLEGEKLNEAINRSWSRLRGAWVGFKAALEKLPPHDPGTSVTRDRLLLPLFQELGYGRLTAAKAIEIESRSYPISHGWLHTPIHLVGWRVDLDRRTAGVAGAARSSPHSLVQELLNRSQEHLWAIASNGRQVRILRDNVSLTRQAYVEFDLEAMMAGEVYADFVLLWLLCHQSRVETEKPEQCWLEQWSKTAQEQGTRALDQLRRGVEVAIATLGQGFLSHAANRELRQKLQSGQLSTQDYYRQLLRLVYRLLFLFVVEDRGFLLDPKADVAARERYTLYYSTARLRTLAEKRRGTRHADLFFGLRLVMQKLGSSEGCRSLGLPALGSLLWSEAFVADTVSCQIANAALLEAIRALAFITDKHGRRPVDYKNLRSEELGSVYEALLELHPELNVSAGTFALTTAAGNERKTTGSYYTPESLVQCLLDSALDPVVDEAVKNALTPQPPLPQGEGEPERWEIPVATQKKMQEVARQLRRQSTQSEAILWEALRNRKLDGRKFRRQHPIGTFVVDFFCQEERLVVEVDGSIHESQKELDRQRQELLESLGLRFVRISSSLVEENLPTALETIRRSFLPSPSGRGAGGAGNPAEQAILNLKVCDPACGSGHFLIAAAHRMAKRLAAIRTGDEEPSPEATQKALRDVIGRCIYGVDVNPMAVELCKVALWMESLEPGKPLSFLEHHIQCGNSLLGATPALLRKGIPDEAFTPIEGDDKAYCSKYKKQNKQEREKGQLTLLDERNEPWERLGDLATSLVNLNQIADDDIAGVERKQTQYEELVKSTPYLFSRFWADAWCAAFVWKKRQSEELLYPITDEVFRQIERNPFNAPDWMRREVEQLRDQYKFFYWHLAFPDVFQVSDKRYVESEQAGWSGGFDVIIGNPPWDKLQPEAPKFFGSLHSDIANARSGSIREKLITKLETDEPFLYSNWLMYRRHIAGTSHFLKNSGFLPRSCAGNINLYRSFGELASFLISRKGQAGVIVQSGFVTDSSASPLLMHLLNRKSLRLVLDFENRGNFFPEVHAQFRFSLVTLTGEDSVCSKSEASFCWLMTSLEEVKQSGRIIALSARDLLLFGEDNPTAPILRCQQELDISRRMYQNGCSVGKAEANLMSFSFLGELFNMNRDSSYFHNANTLQKDMEYLPLYEAKYINQFDHRFASYDNEFISDVTIIKKQNPKFQINSKNYVEVKELKRRTERATINTNWMVGFRDISSATNERTAICTVFPRSAVGHNINLIYGVDAKYTIYLVANCNSFSFDFLCRQKVAGMHVTISILKALPVIPLDKYSNDTLLVPKSSIGQWIYPCALELTYTAWNLQPFAQDCGYDGAPFRWDEDRRFLLRCELDAAYFHLYGIQRDDVDYIMETFPIVKRKDEKAHGHYRTKDKILEIYDAMAEAIETGQPYQTLLDPPPADPSVAHPLR